MARDQRIRTITRMAMLSALSVVMALLIRFPLLPAAPFLEYDAGNIPILIVAFAYGPWHGLIVTLVVSAIQGLTVSSGSGWIGIVMHIAATGAFSIVAGYIYRANKTRGRALLALICGSLVSAVIMCGMNLWLTPLFLNQDIETVKGMILPVILPFNLLKAGINSAITFIIYKHIKNILKLG